MHSALVTNQNSADTSLHLGLVALITSVLTAVILLLVVLGIKRLRSKSGRGVYFSHIFYIAYSFADILQKRQKKYSLSGRNQNGNGTNETFAEDRTGNLSKEISCHLTSQNRFIQQGNTNSSDAHFVTLFKLSIIKKLVYFCISYIYMCIRTEYNEQQIVTKSNDPIDQSTLFKSCIPKPPSLGGGSKISFNSLCSLACEEVCILVILHSKSISVFFFRFSCIEGLT